MKKSDALKLLDESITCQNEKLAAMEMDLCAYI